MKKNLFLLPGNPNIIRYKTHKHNIENKVFSTSDLNANNGAKIKYSFAPNTEQQSQQLMSAPNEKNNEIMDVSDYFSLKNMSPQTKILHAARSWLGTPFHVHGRVKKVGCDCIGLLMGVSQQLAIKSNASDSLLSQFDHANYDLLTDAELLSENLEQHMEKNSDINLGNVVLFKFNRRHQHLGIVSKIMRDETEISRIAKPELMKTGVRIAIIHACSLVGKVVENFVPPKWLGFLQQAFILRL